MKAKELAIMLLQHPDFDVCVGDLVTEHIKRIEVVQVCPIQENESKNKSFLFVLIESTDPLPLGYLYKAKIINRSITGRSCS